MKIKIICDSLCDIPKEIEEKEYLEIVPLTIVVDNKEYKDGIDITKQEFYEIIKSSNEVPKTSQATYMCFKQVFDKYIEEGYKIICINGSSKSSGTYQSAVLAKNDTKGDINIFDTLNLSLGSGHFVIKACELLELGKTVEEIILELEMMREHVHLMFATKNLTYLKKSGRVPVATALIGNMLNIKPIFNLDNGEIKLLEKVRGAKHLHQELVHKILELNDQDLENKVVMIGCGQNIEDLDEIERLVKEKINCKKVYTTRGGACICAHTGPDIIAISSSN